MISIDYAGQVFLLDEHVSVWRIVAGEATVYTLGVSRTRCPCRAWRGCKRCSHSGGNVWPTSTLAARQALRSTFATVMGRCLDLCAAALRTGLPRWAHAAWRLATDCRLHVRFLGLRLNESSMFHLLNVRRMMVDGGLLLGPRAHWQAA